MSKHQEVITVATCDECPYKQTVNPGADEEVHFCDAEPTADNIDCNPATERPTWCRLRDRDIVIQGAPAPPKKPAPRIKDGIGWCVIECPLFRPAVNDAGDGPCRSGSGWCEARGDADFTRCAVPCAPWVRERIAKDDEHVGRLVARADHAESLNRRLNERIATLARDVP